LGSGEGGNEGFLKIVFPSIRHQPKGGTKDGGREH